MIQIRPCLPEEEEASWDLEGRVWALFHQEAEGGAPSEYFQKLHLLALDGNQIVGTIDACPVRWDEDPRSLQGWTEMVRASDRFSLDFEPSGESGLWAGAIGTSIDPSYTQGGLSRRMLEMMRDLALQSGYRGMIAPVRPIFRTRAPHFSIEEYAQLRLPDGRHFDPWVRVHEGLGGKIIGVRENSASFRGTHEQWQEWTGTKLPLTGEIIIPGAADVLRLRNGYGEVREPSIWISHASGE